MEVLAPNLSLLKEVRILSDVRLITRHDLNHIESNDNLQVQFEVKGSWQGFVTTTLCLDGRELNDSDRKSLYPLFTEAMNILVGRQLSHSGGEVTLSPPKVRMIPRSVTTKGRSDIQTYELELATTSYTVITEYSLMAVS